MQHAVLSVKCFDTKCSHIKLVTLKMYSVCLTLQWSEAFGVWISHHDHHWTSLILNPYKYTVLNQCNAWPNTPHGRHKWIKHCQQKRLKSTKNQPLTFDPLAFSQTISIKTWFDLSSLKHMTVMSSKLCCTELKYDNSRYTVCSRQVIHNLHV